MLNDLLVATSARFLGVKEVSGPLSNPLILGWIQQFFPGWRDDSTIAWCAVYMNIIALICEAENTTRLKPGLARGWLKVGEPIEPGDALPGDVMIFSRGPVNGWQGHVTLFLRREGRYAVCLGGNQGSMVTYSRYDTSRLLGVRRLRRDDGAYPKT